MTASQYTCTAAALLGEQDDFGILADWNVTEQKPWGPHPTVAIARLVMWQHVVKYLVETIDQKILEQRTPRTQKLAVLDISGFAGWRYVPKSRRDQLNMKVCDFPQCDIMDLTKFPANHYDIVITEQVIEHVRNPFVASTEVITGSCMEYDTRAFVTTLRFQCEGLKPSWFLPAEWCGPMQADARTERRMELTTPLAFTGASTA